MAEQNKASQEFVGVAKIERGVGYLKTGGVFRVVMVNGLNFDLKSDEEQTLILNSFQNFLNTIDFSVQFFIHSRKVNVDRYLANMRTRQEEETNELLKIQIGEYTEFIRQFVEQNQIINKTFFVVVPQHKILQTDPTKNIMSLFTKKDANEEKMSDEDMIQQLSQRVDEVIAGIEQIGLRAIPLEDEELIELFYNLYNPQLVEKKDNPIGELQKD
jgi:hypothetical protein